MKKILLLIVIGALIGGSLYFANSKRDASPAPSADEAEFPVGTAAANTPAFDPKNATYTIDDTTFTLVNGEAEVEAEPGSAIKLTTEYFGNGTKGDLNGDSMADSAFLITQYGGGSGVFFYVVAALRTSDGYKITNTMFLGDRIAPQTTEIRNGELLVNFADRKEGEAMTEEPTVAVTKRFKVTPAGRLSL